MLALKDWLVCFIFVLSIFLISQVYGQPKSIKITAGVTNLLDVAVYRVGYQYFDEQGNLKEPIYMPEGWLGHFEDATGISCTPFGKQNDKDVLLLHCPWRGGTGITFLEHNLSLPEVKPIKLTFSIALKSDIVDRSDGVTFRVFLIRGETQTKLLEKHYTSDKWQDFHFDLSQYAGNMIILRFEVDPGPDKNPSFDYSFWGNPRIEVGEKRAPEKEELKELLALKNYIADAKKDLRGLINNPIQGVQPSVDDEFTNLVYRAGEDYVFEYKGTDCEIKYVYQPAKQFINDIIAYINGKYSFKPCGFASPTFIVDNKTYNLQSKEVSWQLVSVDLRREHLETQYKFSVVSEAIILNLGLSIQGKSLIISASCPEPKISQFSFGMPLAPLRRSFNIPYLTTIPIYYFPDMKIFFTCFLDWTNSNASWHSQNISHYGAKTDGTRNPLKETCYVTASPELAEVLPNIPHPPSPFIKTLSDRVVLDIWGGTFRENADYLKELKSYGIDNIAIIKHVWQRGGYDNEYPTVLPANKELGGDEDLKLFARTAKELGYLFSLHENYVDYYPNSELYTEKDVALDSQGNLIKAWFNAGINMQSYATKPTAIMKYARMFAPEIHRRYETTAAYLDVHTCVPPWFHVDFQGDVEGSAKFDTVYKAHNELFEYEKKIHEGPLFGEGHSQFYWAGKVDGVEAQVNGGEDAPLLLDFDLLKVHPQMVNHGMGYYERWLRRGYSPGWGGYVLTPEEIDKYRATEIAYGHAGFIGGQIMKVMPYVVKECYLVGLLQPYYINAKPSKILYEVQGNLATASVAVPLGELNRTHIKYDNGLRVYVNRDSKDWQVDKYKIPQFGFLAKGPGVLAYSAKLKGQIADYIETDKIVFADARAWYHLPTLEIKDIQPRVKSFRYLGNRQFEITYEWRIKETLKEDYIVFVHFVNFKKTERPDGITFQQDHTPAIPTSEWKIGTFQDGPFRITVPEQWGPGEYEIRLGLFKPGVDRVWLVGKNDNERRIILGKVVLEGGGEKITNIAFEPVKPEEIPDYKKEIEKYLARLNPERKLVDFGKVSTNGCLRIDKKETELLIMPFPKGERFTIRLKLKQFNPNWDISKARVSALNEEKEPIAAVQLKKTAEEIYFETEVENAIFYQVSL